MLKAKVAIFLGSGAFLTSAFIREEEVPRLFDKHVESGMTIYPLLVRPCPWKSGCLDSSCAHQWEAHVIASRSQSRTGTSHGRRRNRSARCPKESRRLGSVQARDFFGENQVNTGLAFKCGQVYYPTQKGWPYMREQLEQRLVALKSEYEKGQTQLRQLESQSSSLRETLLRISGAIMVLDEVLRPPAPVTSDDGRQGEGIAVGADGSA
jgi:hypothetical protein